VLESVRDYLQALQSQGVPVSFAVLYGSYARGEANEWSDIDLVVVSPTYDESLDYADSRLLWRIAGRTDSRIEPIPCGERQWLEDDSDIIIEMARREGQRILPAA